MIIVVDGNDGSGKTTVVELLRESGYEVRDRGAPTKMTDDPSVKPEEGVRYLILDVPVEVSRQRLARAGKDLNEQYHTVADLTHYRQRFLEVAAGLPNASLIDASGSPQQVLQQCLEALST